MAIPGAPRPGVLENYHREKPPRRPAIRRLADHRGEASWRWREREVWRVKASDGRSGAIKLLYPPHGKGDGRYRLGRFRDEIGFLIAHPDFPGILPLLDSRISDDPAETSWYVMPEAEENPCCAGK